MANVDRAAVPPANRPRVDGLEHPGTHDIELLGCTTEPLMAYLKALGILRLVSEQRDRHVRGWWKDDVFVLRSPALLQNADTQQDRRDALLKFFLEDFEPTPIVAPWGARSGFFPTSSERSAREALETILASESPRLEHFRRTILLVRELLQEMRLDRKAKDEEKLKLLEVCRGRLPDGVLDWLDTCYVLTAESRKYPPLLGTGGNEGSGSYVSGFAQQVVECLVKRRQDHALTAALFGMSVRNVTCSQAPGHFSPTAAGGPNASQGFDGPLATNAWDYLLCLEGTCVWASAAVRRFERRGRSTASFPFTVNPTGAGDSGIAFDDQFKPRQAKREIAEMWLPLWGRPANLSEVRSLISEGRATAAGRNAKTGIDLARAAATLGVDRGIDSFRRTMFLMRNGQNFLNVSLGRLKVRERKEANLLREIDVWLSSFRGAARDKSVPPRFKAALRGIDHTSFDLCRYGGRTYLQSVLLALGRAERELAVTKGRVSQGKRTVRPLRGLSAEWIAQTDDHTPEFSIARALALLRDEEFEVGPIRANLESVDWKKRCRAWAEKDRCVVWNTADLAANLASVLHRRMMDADRAGCEHLPFWSRFTVPLQIVASFLSQDLGDDRIEDLLWGLMLVDPREWSRPTPEPSSDGMNQRDQRTEAPLPRDYVLLKLLFLPRPIFPERSGETVWWRLARRLEDDRVETGLNILPERRIIPLLRAGRIGEACGIAAQRLRASGLLPMPGPLQGRIRDTAWDEVNADSTDARRGTRLAAALLMPISSVSVNRLVELVCREVPASAGTPWLQE